jgi:hypothetical protein
MRRRVNVRITLICLQSLWLMPKDVGWVSRP